MSWDYHDDPRPDVQAVVPATAQHVLDVGCAAGALGAALKARGVAYVAGIEGHPAAASRARERIDFVVEGDVLTVPLPFAPGEFDLIVLADVLEHLPRPEAALDRLLPFLGESGRVVVSVPNMRFYLVLLRLLLDRWSYTDAGIRDRTHLRIFTRRSLLALLESCRLVPEHVSRNYRLFEDQTHIGRVGALLTRIARASVAPLLFADLMAYQYVVVARRRA